MKVPPAGAAMAAPTGGMGVVAMADTARVRFVTAEPAAVTSPNLVGDGRYDEGNGTIGAIEAPAIDLGRTGAGVVSVGGVLGLGERHVLTDPASIVLHEADGMLRASIDPDADGLPNAPAFTSGETF